MERDRLFTQELAIPFARPSLFFDCASNHLNSRLELNQICSRHFQGLIDPQRFAQLVDRTFKVTKALVTCHRFTFTKLIQGILQHCYVLRQPNVGKLDERRRLLSARNPNATDKR
jgi:hypothetical protein